MQDLVIAGVGSTRFGKHEGIGPLPLAVQAARQAILESGIDRTRIGAVYLGNFVGGVLTGQEVLAGLLADALGLPQVPCTKVEGACASGGIAFRHACLAVASGACEAALAVGVEKMTHASTAEVTSALNCAMDNASDGMSGLTFPGLFALAWREYGAATGATRAQLSAVVRKNKANGLKNPLAQMGALVGDDEIIQSPMIADPLTLFDCCPVSDGAAALLVTRADLARHAKAPAVQVLAVAQTRGAARIAGHPSLTSFDATTAAAAQAFATAGLRPDAVDVVELHDCFSAAEIIDSEDLGLVPRGQGAAWAGEGRTAVDGEVAINPSGGLLAKGHPVGATGIGQVYEIVQQLRGRHPNQVKGARIGMTHNLGGTGVACTVSLLRALGA